MAGLGDELQEGVERGGITERAVEPREKGFELHVQFVALWKRLEESEDVILRRRQG